MGNLFSTPTKRGGDIFSDVRQIQDDIQRSKSQSDIAISLKLQQSAKPSRSKFLRSRFGSKSREASVDTRGVQSSASVSSVPQALAAAQERARKRDKSKPSKSRDVSNPKEHEKTPKTVQKSNDTPQTTPSARDDSLKNAAKATDEGKDCEDEAEVFQPSAKKPGNPFADAPKRLDEVFGEIRKSEPVPEVMPLDVDRNVAVYFETGDYSVSGLGEDVKLKPKQLTARQGTPHSLKPLEKSDMINNYLSLKHEKLMIFN